MSRLGKLFVIAAPSGAGKTSLVNALVQSMEGIQISISYTTRPARPNDREGVDYHFIDESVFQSMVAEDAFLEHATVFGHYYGTSKKWVLNELKKGVDVILEIDWQGAQQMRRQFSGLVSIFILPPSTQELCGRLQRRQQDEEGVIFDRMAKSQLEMSHYAEFDYLIVNDDFTRAEGDLRSIISAERLRLHEQIQEQARLLADLLQKD